ncbi:hypothetical protein NC651_036535 [Populus alba x Populus x berolinensis]|nr:hypothetical protein NC651_036535 [Populus alba x Populus x berolinensis]
MSSSQCLERIHQTWPQVMEKGQSKKLVAWKPVLPALQTPTLPSFSFLMFLEARSKVAAAGFSVVVPDFLYGDPVDLSKPDFDSHGEFLERWTSPFVGCHSSEIHESKGMDSIGAAGSCWGVESFSPIATNLLNFTFLLLKMVSEVKIPVAFLGAEIDRASPPEQLKEHLQNLSILDSSLFDLSMSHRDEKAEEDSPAFLAVEDLCSQYFKPDFYILQLISG